MNNQAIGIFDSGIGGLSVFQEIKKLLPFENLIYFADQAFCPYGTKSQSQIRKRVLSALSFFEKQKVKLVVIACNTATTVGIDYYREKFPKVPIIGVVPVIKTAGGKTVTKKVLILVTQSTIENPYLNVLINKFGKGIKFFKLGDWEGQLVKMIENGELKQKKIEKELDFLLTPFLNQNIDTVVLGCTHFPLIRNQIQDIFGARVQILDSGGAVARHTQRVLENKGLLAENQKPDYTFYTTANIERLNRSIQNFIYILNAKVKKMTFPTD